MSDTWFQLDWYGQRLVWQEIQVDRETEKRVFGPLGWLDKDRAAACIRRTRAECLEVALVDAQGAVRHARRRLELANSFEGNVRGQLRKQRTADTICALDREGLED